MIKHKFIVNAYNIDKQLRSSGRTRTWLATKCNISVSYLCQILSNSRNPRPELGKRMMLFTRLSYDDFYIVKYKRLKLDR